MSSTLRRSFAKCVVVFGLTLLAPACSQDTLLEVDNPNTIDPNDLLNSLGAPALYAGAVSELTSLIDYGSPLAGGFAIGIVAGLFTDEAMHASTPPAVREWDLRNVLSTNTTAPPLFLGLQRARVRNEQSAVKVAELTTATDKRVGEMWAMAAWSYIFLAELYCSGVPISNVEPFELGNPLSTNELLDLALDRLNTAGSATEGDARIINLIAVLRGRALLDKGEKAAAAEAVATVPTGYIYQFIHSATTPRQTNQIPVQFNSNIYSVPDREGTNGMDFASAGDPRVPVTSTGVSVNDRVTPMNLLTKYATNADPVTHASGIEARLIEAEAALPADPTTWLAKLNEARASLTGLAPLDDPGTEASRVDLTFRERAFWLYMTGHRLGDLRRLVRQYGRPAESVYPTGAYHKQGLTRGTQVAWVVPQPEENNPNYTASACDPTQP
jgi:hypothetical protein